MLYAVFEDGSRQFRVAEGDQLEVNFRDVEVGNPVEFDRVLLVRAGDGLEIGSPTVKDAKVVAEVLEHTLGEKIYVQKFRRRKNYHRRTGHRQRLTRVRVQRIVSAGTAT